MAGRTTRTLSQGRHYAGYLLNLVCAAQNRCRDRDLQRLIAAKRSEMRRVIVARALHLSLAFAPLDKADIALIMMFMLSNG